MTAAIMTAPEPVSLPGPAAAQPHPNHAGRAIFVYTASRDGSTVMELSGYEAGDGVTVEAEIYPVRRGDARMQRRSHVFPTRELAKKFVDEALITFEYMGCTIRNLAPTET
jgi:hypothetical protein